jgi:hypothetical protein
MHANGSQADRVSAAGQGDFLERGKAEPKKDQGAASGPPRAIFRDSKRRMCKNESEARNGWELLPTRRR